ncbi:MAG: hypothetical protein ACOC5T_01670 [Elusimicrobiota bacterium]
MKFDIQKIEFEDREGNIIIERYVETEKGYIHIPIRTGEITNLKQIRNKEKIGEIDLDLPVEYKIVKRENIKYKSV